MLKHEVKLKDNLVLISCSLIIALMLSILPLPTWAIWFRPCWVVMVILFWQISAPQNLGLSIVWLLGLTMDALYGSVLGQHAFTLVIIYYLASKFARLMRILPLWQQTSIIALLIIIDQLILTFIQVLFGDIIHTWFFVFRVLSSIVLWPLVYIFMIELHKKYV